MQTTPHSSRRNFLKQSSFTLSAGLTGVSLPVLKTNLRSGIKLPREITVVGIDLLGLWPEKTMDARIKKMLGRMEDISGLQPDVVCLPELFSSIWVAEKKNIAAIAEDEKDPGPVTSAVGQFARKHNCYVVCPLLTTRDGHYYNSSLLIDRKGNIAGVYHKIHALESEILPDHDFKGGGVTPGAFNQPVIETDFGKVGLQICFDANWSDGWDNLRKQGAEIVFFSSAFPGGRMLNQYAFKNDFYIVSGTGGDARVIDISGNDLDVSSEFVRYAWQNINLEKVNLTEWPACGALPDLFKKYGQQLNIKVWDRTDVITIESVDPDLKLATVLTEFNIETSAEMIRKQTEVQDAHRPG